MNTKVLRLAWLILGFTFLWVGAKPALAQCPTPGWNGDEPADFTHYLDDDEDGICDGLAPMVNDTYPNRQYPDCDIPDVGHQTGHGHWEYTRLQTDERTKDTEEKDYLTLTQAMEKDFENQDTNGTATRESIGQTIRFSANEPERFDRAIRPGLNPSGRYWQVDEWIGPGSESYGSIPGLAWTERFFECASETEIGPCAKINGTPAYGAYWSNDAAQFGYVNDCGDPLVATPSDPDGRSPQCGIALLACQ